MSDILPRLRPDLDFMPSPVEDRPGLLIRDPFQFSDYTLIIPPEIAECLAFFDGTQSKGEVKAELVRFTGNVQAGLVLDHIHESLDRAGFLENDTHVQNRAERQAEFAAAPERLPAHCGTAYPEDQAELSTAFTAAMAGDTEAASAPATLGIAAPHVSPDGGWASYKAAYRALGDTLSREEAADRTFVLLGTSHYGQPERFGLTRKGYRTPFGCTRTDRALVDELARRAPGAVLMEDYCHAVEHSLEFQVLFLQHLYGPEVRILPILCGSFLRSLTEGGRPEECDEVRAFVEVLGDIHARESRRLTYVLGVDMAHMGQRYGDAYAARAGQGELVDVAERDLDRIARINEGDARGFWERVQEGQDDLKWCGSAPIYTFLQAVPQARGTLLRYDQWNIDEVSVVSFGGLAFRG